MLGRTNLSIPFELQRIKAQQIYEKRIAEGKDGNSEKDWETARRYLCKYPEIILVWKVKQVFVRSLQLSKSSPRRLWQSFKALINGIWKILTLPLWLICNLPQLFANVDTREYALDVVKTIFSAALFISAIIAAIGLFVNYQDALKDRQITQERLITDRFTKAVAQIGNDKEEVVIGGIYSLERIAKDSPKDQWTIMEVLSAFVRNNSLIPLEIKEDKKTKALEKLKPVSIKVQAALTVIKRRNSDLDNIQKDKEIKSINLTESNLNNADLSNADLSSANLSNTLLLNADLSNKDKEIKSINLTESNLNNADLSNADLSSANLSNSLLLNADLSNVDLSNANLSNVDISNAMLYEANLYNANLSNSNLHNAKLGRANLRSADLSHANLSDTFLFDADLSHADLSHANLSNVSLVNTGIRGVNLFSANLSNTTLAYQDLSSINLNDANLFGANLYKADVNNSNLSNTQIKSACFWEQAIYTDLYFNQTELRWVLKNKQANQKKIAEIRQDKASDPKISPDCKYDPRTIGQKK